MKYETIPTAYKAWPKRFPNFTKSQNWNKSFENIYRTTANNKLKEFEVNFKLLDRILVTNKEQDQWKIEH